MKEKVIKSIERLKNFEPPEGYYLAFSGGKDSIVIHNLAIKAGVKFDAHYNITTIDPPELIWFIKKNYPNVSRDRPKRTIWSEIIAQKFPPTRRMRYCCAILKEKGAENRIAITGVRWAESARRKAKRSIAEFHTYKDHILFDDNTSDRRMFETCKIKSMRVVNPIVDWSDEDVWNYIKYNDIAYCSLYDEGFKRLGCIGCPIAGPKQIIKEFNRWPKFKQLYTRTFQKLAELYPERWPNAEYIMSWYLSGKSRKEFDSILYFDFSEVKNDTAAASASAEIEKETANG